MNTPTEHPRLPCGCGRAAVNDGGFLCSLCQVDVVNDEAMRAAPTIAYARCNCGGALDPLHRCVDPVGEAFALWLAAEEAEEQFAPELRVFLRRRRIAHQRAATAARLAEGPPLR